ncbi:hypothetical protein AH448_24085 [Salmonella enterica subsp. diarizonae]|nr:hypothetical protein [Salmonella enterica]EAT2559709.1 hypothetical protein [Salmonella enterica]EAW1826479.1 hypothetical protein [Salmonella enterica subsp. diarizonae]ECE0307142.1 hypothetical protein [Salmonella enterica subsp. diarizonae]
MNGDNPSQSRPLLHRCTRGRFCLDFGQKKTAGSPAVNACMDRFVFCLYATGQILARITDR